MNQVNEYISFLWPIVAMLIGGYSTFVYLVRKQDKIWHWWYLIPAFGFCFALGAGYSTMRLKQCILLEASMAKPNFISDEIQNYSEYAIWLIVISAAFLLVSFCAWIIKKHYNQKKTGKSTIGSLVLIIFSALHAQSQESGNANLVWYGSEKDSAFEYLQDLNLVSKATMDIQTYKKVIFLRENPRVSNTIEVFNNNSKQWISSKITTDYIGKVSKSSPNKIKQKTKVMVGREVAFLSSCRVGNVRLELSDSTPEASTYVELISTGEIDKNGILSKEVGGYCIGQTINFLAKKSNCEEFKEPFKVETNPQEYKKAIKLKCTK